VHGSPRGSGTTAGADVRAARLAREALLGATQPRNDFFGWFGPFIPFTGTDILTLVNGAAVALLAGMATVAVARRRARRAHA
jgi:hypothetical protein